MFNQRTKRDVCTLVLVCCVNLGFYINFERLVFSGKAVVLMEIVNTEQKDILSILNCKYCADRE